MKKGLYFVFVLVLLFALVGCNKTDDGTKTTDKDETQDNEYQSEWETYINQTIPNEITENIELDDTFTFSDGNIGLVNMSTNSSPSLTSAGKYKGKPIDQAATLTCYALVEGLDEPLIYDKEVVVKGYMSVEEYISKVNEYVIPSNIYKDTPLPQIEDVVFADKEIQGTIEYTSDDESLLGSDGAYYNTSDKDISVIMNYTIEIEDLTIEGSKVMSVMAKDDDTKLIAAKEWLNSWYNENGILKGDTTFPETDDQGIVSISWTSNDHEIIDDEGVFYQYDTDQAFSMNAIISLNGTVSDTFEYTFITIPEKDALEYILDRMYQTTYQQALTDTAFGDLEDFGLLNFFAQDIAESSLIIRENTDGSYVYGDSDANASTLQTNLQYAIAPHEFAKRTGIIMDKEFIVMHDTGSLIDADGWATHMLTSDRDASWHFTVSDTVTYQHIPLDEVAWHAGCGAGASTIYKLSNTGIKYTKETPEITINKEDGYYYINGQKSIILAPIFEGTIYTDITPAGIYTEIGSDGNYWMNSTYYNDTYKLVSNYGGNTNGIGLETCINAGVKYTEVMRTSANLVAHLLSMYGLSIHRVLQHRNFSGKVCPQTMIRMNTYDDFLEMIETQYFLIKHFPGLDISYESANSDLLDNKGYLLSYVTEDTDVTYTVTAKYNEQTVTKTYTTTILAKQD